MNKTIKPPKGMTDEQAAQWYEQHPEYLDSLIDQAEATGKLTRARMTPAERLAWAQAQRKQEEAPDDGDGETKGMISVTIRMPQEDVQMARLIAEHRAMRYQSYIKTVLHKVLQNDYDDLRRTEKHRGFKAVQWYDPSIGDSRYRVWHYMDVVSDGGTYDETSERLEKLGVSHLTVMPVLVEAEWTKARLSMSEEAKDIYDRLRATGDKYSMTLASTLGATIEHYENHSQMAKVARGIATPGAKPQSCDCGAGPDQLQYLLRDILTVGKNQLRLKHQQQK